MYQAAYAKSDVMANQRIDNTKLEIAALAEITDVTIDEISGNSNSSFVRTKPSQLS